MLAMLLSVLLCLGLSACGGGGGGSSSPEAVVAKAVSAFENNSPKDLVSITSGVITSMERYKGDKLLNHYQDYIDDIIKGSRFFLGDEAVKSISFEIEDFDTLSGQEFDAAIEKLHRISGADDDLIDTITQISTPMSVHLEFMGAEGRTGGYTWKGFTLVNEKGGWKLLPYDFED
jgi:hypothetical protein